jgi:uncharacterized PurR-regulated membrane protein YhhQ (DUF165 family)
MTGNSSEFKSFMVGTISLQRWRFFLFLLVFFFFVHVSMNVLFDLPAKRLLGAVIFALFLSAWLYLMQGYGQRFANPGTRRVALVLLLAITAVLIALVIYGGTAHRVITNPRPTIIHP